MLIFPNYRIAKDFRDNTSLMRLVSRHFYEEKVFNDSSSDSTVIRWRYRNVFSDNVLYGDKPQDHGSQVEYGRSPHGHDSHADSRVASISDSNDKKVSVKSKQLPVSMPNCYLRLCQPNYLLTIW